MKPDRLPDPAILWDMAIIGGGIHGMAAARVAACRGLRTLLLERADFGSQTSANSLKIIHGGLRYVQNLDIARMRETAREQAWLLSAAPGLVRPLECVMPTYPHPTRSKLAMRTGLWLYKRLAGGQAMPWPGAGTPAPGVFDRRTLLELVPKLEDSRITGGARWYDAQAVNTERLGLAFLRSAQRHGAVALNYVEASGLIAERGRVSRLAITDTLSGETGELAVRTVLDCTGRSHYGASWHGLSACSPPMDYMRAVNLVINRPLAALAFGFRTAPGANHRPSEQLLFSTPWNGQGIIGTWYYERAATDRKEEVLAALADINSVFGGPELTLNDVTRIHEGWLPATRRQNRLTLRSQPLISHAADHGGPRGLVFARGVKYTTARAVARSAVELTASAGGLSLQTGTDKDELTLAGISPVALAERLERAKSQYSPLFGEEIVHRLFHWYGTDAEAILGQAAREPGQTSHVPVAHGLLRAEIAYMIEQESVHTLADLVVRRTGLGAGHRPSSEIIGYFADMLSHQLGWDAQRRDQEMTGIMALYPHWDLP
ncbi:MAG: FAD-dependent oxidoreductase [Aquisalimonadaceae bacterium]